jgi:hypothetical protein
MSESDQDKARASELVRDTPKLPVIEINELAGHHQGNPRSLPSRLFMQLLVYRVSDEQHPDAVINRAASVFEANKVPGVIYRDANDPRSIGVLTWSEQPEHFVTTVRSALLELKGITLRDDFTMFGRTYATGYEDDLEHWLIKRPVLNATNEKYRWAVWYPLRRNGAFEALASKEQAGILREHAAIGRAYGEQDLATDIRLACHGIDAQDNEFLLGILSKDLHPLSHLVQRMRKTQQTSMYIQHMGPFFVGYVAWQRA